MIFGQTRISTIGARLIAVKTRCNGLGELLHVQLAGGGGVVFNQYPHAPNCSYRRDLSPECLMSSNPGIPDKTQLLKGRHCCLEAGDIANTSWQWMEPTEALGSGRRELDGVIRELWLVRERTLALDPRWPAEYALERTGADVPPPQMCCDDKYRRHGCADEISLDQGLGTGTDPQG